MGERKIQSENYQRTAELCARVLSEESREVELSFSSEQPVERWFGSEILCHDLECVDMSRLEAVGSLLFHHGRDANYGSLPLGKITRTWVDSGSRRAKATVIFDTDEKSDLIYKKIQSGSIKGISVGYQIEVAEELAANAVSSNGRFTGPCTVATRWIPHEISIEPVPADDQVGIGRAMKNWGENNGIKDFRENESEGNSMSLEEKSISTQPAASTATHSEGSPAIPPTVDASGQIRDAVASERQRTNEITSICREFEVASTDYISNGTSVDEVRRLILNQLKAVTKPLPAGRVSVEADEEDKYRAAATSGLLARMGFIPEKPAEGFRDFQGMSLRDLMIDCVARTGEANPHRMDEEELMRHAFNLDRGALADSSSFLSVVNGSMHAVMSQAYKTAPTTYQHWTSTGSNSDFKAATRYRMSASGEMQLIPENGEFQNDTATDEGVDTKLATYGKKFGFGRQTIINDNLGAVAKAIAAQVRSVERFKNKKCYELLCKNGKIYDHKLLFCTDHQNLFTSATLSLESLNEMIVAMAKQQDMSKKETLNVTPKFLLVPIALQMAANRLIESAADPSGANSGVYNPMKGRFIVIADAVIDTLTTKGYYAVADQMDVDTIEVTYLNGRAQPMLESNVIFDQLGVQYRMYHDFGMTALDYRGLAFNPGK